VGAFCETGAIAGAGCDAGEGTVIFSASVTQPPPIAM